MSDTNLVQYQYVGPAEILSGFDGKPIGRRIINVQDIWQWIADTTQEFTQQMLIATFIVNIKGGLMLSERHSEHVRCAGGAPVLSAGEITFLKRGKEMEVVEISNQSTGYCPRPASWPALQKALAAIGMAYPEGFTQTYEFRYCSRCESINLIKEQVFICSVCDTALSLAWNLDQKK